MRSRNRVLIGLLLGLPLCLLAYEGGAVLRARGRTAEVLEQVRVREVAFASIPARRMKMLLAVEDPGFLRHRGIDFSTPGQGMTTLTQSLAKLLYFRRFTPGIEKLELMLVARFALDPAMSKREQLEVFINHAGFGTSRGRPIIGFNAAARTFYGRELGELTDREYLTLVAMLIAPSRLDPARHPGANAERTSRIEALLAGRCRPRGLRDVHYQDCAPVRR
jgi:membrane carboxypeptidase/penicillin-binding protein